MANGMCRFLAVAAACSAQKRTENNKRKERHMQNMSLDISLLFVAFQSTKEEETGKRPEHGIKRNFGREKPEYPVEPVLSQKAQNAPVLCIRSQVVILFLQANSW